MADAPAVAAAAPAQRATPGALAAASRTLAAAGRQAPAAGVVGQQCVQVPRERRRGPCPGVPWPPYRGVPCSSSPGVARFWREYLGSGGKPWKTVP